MCLCHLYVEELQSIFKEDQSIILIPCPRYQTKCIIVYDLNKRKNKKERLKTGNVAKWYYLGQHTKNHICCLNNMLSCRRKEKLNHKYSDSLICIDPLIRFSLWKQQKTNMSNPKKGSVNRWIDSIEDYENRKLFIHSEEAWKGK